MDTALTDGALTTQITFRCRSNNIGRRDVSPLRTLSNTRTDTTFNRFTLLIQGDILLWRSYGGPRLPDSGPLLLFSASILSSPRCQNTDSATQPPQSVPLCCFPLCPYTSIQLLLCNKLKDTQSPQLVVVCCWKIRILIRFIVK